MSKHVLNFAAGPAALPREVLLKAQSELLDFGGSGISVMELSHRSKEFEGILNLAIADVKVLVCSCVVAFSHVVFSFFFPTTPTSLSPPAPSCLPLDSSTLSLFLSLSLSHSLFFTPAVCFEGEKQRGCFGTGTCFNV